MTDRSKIIIDTLNRDLHSGEFTIYEGSWGDKYGARIERWYEPNTGKSYQVAVKNYIVEGCMR